MGAGVALAFKKKYPKMFKEYAKSCKNQEIKPGHPSVWSDCDLFSKDIEIINFPTKDHWRRPSEYAYVESGLIWLSNYLKCKSNKIVTLPALGCGHGGLDWKKVRQLILDHLKDSPAKILVFEPSSSKNAGKVPNGLSNLPSKLSAVGVHIINDQSPSYPSLLHRYTGKDLYFLGSNTKNIEFDVTLICGSKPTDQEREVVQKFIAFCSVNKLSILFGGSVFEKKLAVECSINGLDVGVFLPAGIFQSAEKIRNQKSYKNIILLSIGDPFKTFDKKEYLPSVLSRMFITHKTII
jgi:O-acetyl-ADP-ribose deacetylase (regulator of RNase III)